MTQKRNPRGPVAWLLGRQLLATLKQILLYVAFGDRLDPRDWMSPAVEDIDADSTGDFWFDYIADAGDGQTAMYAVAVLCLSDLHGDADPQVGDELRLQTGGHVLPRGHFLFVGGDTAYHVADVRALKERFVRPFEWACADLGGPSRVERRPLYAIPGNHDWYDSLDGFRAQFRRHAAPVTHTHPGSPPPTAAATPAAVDPLAISAFERRQDASYVALHLPHDWWFIGMDAQGGELDSGQQAFYSQLGLAEKRRLVLATPEPSTVFGKLRGVKLSETLQRLGLDVPFVHDGDLPARKVRLDLAGDVHHYARYWGPRDAGGGKPNYASVVSGLGGAFLHSPTTDYGEIPAEAIYPERSVARAAFARELFQFWNVMRGGYVWLVGGILSVIAYFGLLVSDSGRHLLSKVWPGEVPGPAGPVLGWLHQQTFSLPGGGDGVLFRSLLFLLTLVGSGLFFWLADRLRQHLAKRDRAPDVYIGTLHQIPLAACVTAGVALPLLGMWLFGRQPAAVLVIDVLLLVVLFLPIGFAGIAVMAAKNLRFRGKAGFALLGFGHGLLQVLTPFLLAWRASWIAWGAVAAGVPLGAYLGYLAMRGDRRAWLVMTFSVQAVGLVLVALLTGESRGAHVLGLLLAFGFGSVLSCIWFGWYLAVSLAFNGHNNEAGGAARIEQFKEMVRIRLRRDELTAWVIAVDEPSLDLAALRPRVVDRFTLRLAG